MASGATPVSPDMPAVSRSSVNPSSVVTSVGLASYGTGNCSCVGSGCSKAAPVVMATSASTLSIGAMRSRVCFNCGASVGDGGSVASRPGKESKVGVSIGEANGSS